MIGSVLGTPPAVVAEVELLHRIGIDHESLAAALQRLDAATLPIDEVVALVADAQTAVLAACTLRIEASLADRALELAWPRLSRKPLLAAAAKVAPQLSDERALIWSARLRADGLDRFCPLVVRAGDPAALVSRRVRSGAIAWRAFADPVAREAALHAAGELVAPLAIGDVRRELEQLAPELIAEFAVITAALADTGTSVSEPHPSVGGATIIISPPANPTRWPELLATIRERTTPTDYEIVLLARERELEFTESVASTFTGCRVVPVLAERMVDARSSAVSNASGEMIVFLAGDHQPIAGWLEALYLAANRWPDAGIFVPNEVDASGVARHGVEILLDARDEPMILVRSRYAPVRRGTEVTPVVEIQAGSGAAIAVRAALFGRLNGFDHSFEEPWATADLCLRAGVLGVRTAHVPMTRLLTDAPVMARLDDDERATPSAIAFHQRWFGVVGPDRVIGRLHSLDPVSVTP